MNRFQIVFELIKDSSTDFLTRENLELPVLDIVANLEEFQMLKGQDFFRSRFSRLKSKNHSWTNFRQKRRRLWRQITTSRFCILRFLRKRGKHCFKSDLTDKFQYFDYEHFYVFCYLFNELDDDEDGFIGRAEIEKYSRHYISSITVDRFFAGVGIKFKNTGTCISPIDFCDFVRLVVYEEDKMTTPSIIFWFKILDLDGDGVLRYWFNRQCFRTWKILPS